MKKRRARPPLALSLLPSSFDVLRFGVRGSEGDYELLSGSGVVSPRALDAPFLRDCLRRLCRRGSGSDVRRACPTTRSTTLRSGSGTPGDPSRDIASITDTKTNRVLPQLGSVALQAGERAGENIARLVAGNETEPFAYHDKGMMATIGRGAAVVQFHRGRTMKGKAAAMAWGTVHLALLSTGEDRAKAIADWTWAGFAHERPGRITVRTDKD